MVLTWLLAASGFAFAFEADQRCASMLDEWRRAFDAVKECSSAYRQLKDESVSSAIEDRISDKGKRKVAAVVRDVLQDRKARLETAGKELESRLGQEKDLFTRWRSCIGQGRKASNARANSPEVREREEYIGQARELLLDEAYVQYKDYRAPGPRYSYENPQASGRNPWGYGQSYGGQSSPSGYGYDPRRGAYPGYFR
jgi:hypothetical protein